MEIRSPIKSQAAFNQKLLQQELYPNGSDRSAAGSGGKPAAGIVARLPGIGRRRLSEVGDSRN
jgi:hypothetical protein